jgi:tetratricopeptide (TPR) repeat protein
MTVRRAGARVLFSIGFSMSIGCGGTTPPASAPSVDPPLTNGPASAPEQAPLSAEVTKGVTALDANDLVGAKIHFQAALHANPNDADAMYYLGALSEKAGDAAGAEASYKSALAARAGFAGAEVNLSALYDDAQRFDEALAITTPGLTEHPKEGGLHLNAGIAYGGKKDAASATREFDAAIAIAPRDPTYRLVYGHWLVVLGQKDAALTQLHAAVPLADKNVGLVAAIGHELHVDRAFADCVTVFSQAITLKDAAELWTERASCKIGQKDDAGALADLHAATTKDPTYAPAQYYLGNELAKAGQYGPAVAAYQAFLKLEPNGPLAKAVAEKIRLAKQHRAH